MPSKNVKDISQESVTKKIGVVIVAEIGSEFVLKTNFSYKHLIGPIMQ